MSIKQQEYNFVIWSKQVSQQTYDVARIVEELRAAGCRRVADIGGGIGSVGQTLMASVEGLSVDVYESSELARDAFLQQDGLRLIFGDFLQTPLQERYDAVLFRTVLHHFIGEGSKETLRLQNAAIAKAASALRDDGLMFVTENFYQSMIGSDTCGEVIYQLTRLKTPAKLFRAMGANTAGEGVRFRSFPAWKAMFEANRLHVSGDITIRQWHMPLWRRAPLLCSDAFQGLVKLKKSPA